MKIIFAFLLSIILTTNSTSTIFAAIFINEFSYQSSSDWVELYNSECSSISLEGWKIRDSTESQFKSLSGTILPKSVLSFDITFLNNSTPDSIRLFSPENTDNPYSQITIPIEGFVTSSENQSVSLEVDGGSSWKVFDNNTKGSLNFLGDELCPEVSTTPTPPATGGEQTQTSFSQNALIITEILPDPLDGDEWVEIYNPKDFSIELSNFQIDDIESGSKPSNLPKYILEPLQYFVYYTSSIFNNGGDSARILYKDQVINSYSYPASTKGVSFAIDAFGNWQKTTDPTPGEVNSIVAVITPTPTATPTVKPTPTTKPTPTPKITKTPTPKKVLGIKTSSTDSAVKKQNQVEEITKTDNFIPFYISTALITLGFLVHTVYFSNKKKINKKIKKSKVFKKLKSILKIV